MNDSTDHHFLKNTAIERSFQSIMSDITFQNRSYFNYLKREYPDIYNYLLADFVIYQNNYMERLEKKRQLYLLEAPVYSNPTSMERKRYEKRLAYHNRRLDSTSKVDVTELL